MDNSQPELEMAPAWKLFAYGAASVIGIGVIILGIIFLMGLRRGSEHPAVVATARLLHIPVGRVNGRFISYSDYAADRSALKKFYGSQPEGYLLTEEQTSDQALSRLIGNRLLEQLAEQHAVTVTADDMAAAKQRLFGVFPDETTAAAEIQTTYGWTIPQFEQKVIIPYIREQKLKEKFAAGEGAFAELNKTHREDARRARHVLVAVSANKTGEQAKREAEALLRRVTTGKEDFAAVAKAKSDDATTKDNGGELPIFVRGELERAFEETAFGTEPGQVAARAVETRFGYHIIKVEEKLRVPSFRVFVNEELRQAKLKLFLPIHNPLANLPSAESATESAATQ